VSGKHRPLLCDDVNLMGESISTVKKHRSSDNITEVPLDVNAK
jgi:hypothetical protein